MDGPLSAFIAQPGEAGPGAAGVDAILDAVRLHLGMEIAFAARYIDGRREFTHIRTDLPIPHKPGYSEPQEESFCWHILNGDLPELIHNAADNALARSLPVTDALPVGAHMDVPLRLKDGTVYGSFCCLSRSPDYSLNQRDLATLRAFADLAGQQIEVQRAGEAEQRASVARIDMAIAAGLPSILYQPIHRLDTLAPAGVEALARFGGADTRPPNLWFSEAAGIGRGLELELAAIGAALNGLPYLPGDAYMSVNASPATILSGKMEPMLAVMPAGRIVIELTEHEAVADYRELREALSRLRRHARIAIDDMGAGYANLRHLIDLAPDIVKLDMSLTRDVHRDPARRALTGAMVEFTSRMGCAIVAEGVECEAEAEALRGLGVGYGQGWHFARPMPAAALRRHMAGTVEDGRADVAASHRRGAGG